MLRFQHIIENNAGLLIFGIVLVSLIGGLVQIVPLAADDDTYTPAEGLVPYPALELAGRDVYIRESCGLCHTQQVRPFAAEVLRYGPALAPADFVYERPALWGSKRTGPDLLFAGGKYSDDWHRLHMRNPRAVVPQSTMPSYGWLDDDVVDGEAVQSSMRALASVGHPYTDADIADAPAAVEDATEMDALIAYLQSLGRRTREQQP